MNLFSEPRELDILRKRKRTSMLYVSLFLSSSENFILCDFLMNNFLDFSVTDYLGSYRKNNKLFYRMTDVEK